MEMTDRELLVIVAEKVGKLTQNVGEIKSDVGELKSDIGGLKSDVGELKSDVGELKSDVQSIKNTVIHIENDHGAKLKALFDGYVQNSDKLDRIEKEVSIQEEVILRKIK